MFGSATAPPVAKDGGGEAAGAAEGAADGAGVGAAEGAGATGGAVAGGCEKAGPQSSSEAPLTASICLFNTDVTSELLPPMVGGLISISPGEPARDATIQRHQSIEIRTSAAHEAETRRGGSRDRRTRRPLSGTRIRPPPAAAAGVAW